MLKAPTNSHLKYDERGKPLHGFLLTLYSTIFLTDTVARGNVTSQSRISGPVLLV